MKKKIGLIALDFVLAKWLYEKLRVSAPDTPAAGVTSMFAVRYGRDAESAAQVITLTTLLSIITLPIFGVLATAWS